MTVVLSDTGAIAMMSLLKADVDAAPYGWFIAAGSGDTGWDSLGSIPAPPATATGLVAHWGHFKATTVQYVTPDAGGALATGSNERWSTSGSPTRYLYIEAPVDFADAPTETIRELALYVKATPGTGHESQNFLPPADLDALGTLLTMERITATPRNGTDGVMKLVFRIGEAAA